MISRPTLWRAAIVAALLAVGADAAAQASNRPLRRLELTGGLGLFGGASLGDGDASLRANSTPPQPFLLFHTETRLERATAVELRLGSALSRRFEAEARFALSHPELRSSITSDVENAPALTVVERVDQYVIDGALLVLFDEAGFGGAVPFASAGAGYLRQLHEGLTVIDAGRVYHVGGGLKRWFFSRGRGLARSAGARADARLYLLGGGVALDEGLRSHLAISGSLFLTF